MIGLDEINAAVAEAFGVSVGDILGADRTREVANPRQCAFFLARKHTKLSYPQIGRGYGRDHTTVLHGVKRWPEKERQSHDARKRRNHAETILSSIIGPSWPFIPAFRTTRHPKTARG